MHDTQTRTLGSVQPRTSLATGRILVIDDDLTFGGFMLAALETRGHTVDWAGCVADGVASLWSGRYDLVIADLRLPDGSGFDFLRQATEGGLLAGSSAIILTGHDDFETPADVRVFSKSMELEPFLDRIADIVAATKRRQNGNGRSRPGAEARGAGRHDGRHSSKAPRVDLVLYVSPDSEKCQKAIRAVRGILERYNAEQVKFTICDLSGEPERADVDGIVFTPTLVKRAPGPRTWIVGNLDQPDLLVDLLDMSGVDRRRDGSH